MKNCIDNMRVEFNLIIPQNEDWSKINNDNIINKPIIDANGKLMGVILEAELDESRLWFKCKGIIWEKYIKCEFTKDNTNELVINSIVLE